MYLRSYFTSEQLSQIKIGDKVRVVADFGGNARNEYEGTIQSIATESEFTPKTIQTNDSRASLVYAVKIVVNNDGRLKIGFTGEVFLEQMNDIIIDIKGITKHYDKVEALKDINLSIIRGELFGIIGPDGVGKTTLFHILTTLLESDKGTAIVNGYDVKKYGATVEHYL